jgi:glycosyltransferase involved in cell wall biosynthesis
MPTRPAIYSFRFPHHGIHASYHRLVDYLPANCDIIDITSSKAAFWKYPKLNRLWFRLNELRMLSRLRSQAVSCVHYLYPENSLFNAHLWAPNKPLVLTWHLPLTYIYGLPHHVQCWTRAAIESASAVIFLSSESRKKHIADLRMRNSYVIKHGVDTTYFTFNEPTHRNRPLNILTVGSVLRDQRFWAQVVRLMLEQNASVNFQVICSEESRHLYRRWLRDESPRVSFLRNLDDNQLLSLYAEADIAFLPLQDATANNFLLESMSSGLPLVVSDLPATREYAGETAFYVSSKDAEDAARKLTFLAESLQTRRCMAFAARRKAEAELNWPVIAEQLCRIYSGFN